MAQKQQIVVDRAGEGIRETLESVIIAFVLAFVFRAFIVEAFVIPTGSMAPTLYGVHGMQTCQDCGTVYAFGLPEKLDDSYRDRRRDCPNCNKGDVSPPITLNVHESGDRILVLKWPFDIGGASLGPKRWDVVVFKDPSDGVQNFIKRLVGLPNQVLEIIDGDIYTADVPRIEAEDPGLLALLREQLRLDRQYGELAAARRHGEQSQTKDDLLALADRIQPRLDPFLGIQRKIDTPTGRRAQKSLWFPVHDQDHRPHRPRRDTPPARWVPQGQDSPWKAATPVITFDGADHDERFVVFTPTNGIRDTYAYNEVASHGSNGARFNVGDLRLRFVLTRLRGDGFVRLSLSKGPDTFVATLHHDGRATLERRGATHATTETYSPAQAARLEVGRPVRVELANLDYRVSFRIDDREILTATYGPSSLADLREPQNRHGLAASKVMLSAGGMDVQLRHITLDRDVYYQAVRIRNGKQLRDERTGKPVAFWEGRPGWGVAGHPILLRPKEYLMLGDNSPQSADSRLWSTIGPHLRPRGDDYQVGTVAEDQLIGRAFFVYWPSGLRLFSSRSGSRFPWGLRVVPNVGDMRWIR